MRRHNSPKSRRQLKALATMILVVAALWLLSVRAEEAVYHGTVMRVSAGEKLLVRTRHRTFRVRLAGIRAPRTGQPFATAAQHALRRLLSGRKVRVAQVGSLRSGWMAADVYRDQVHVNAELVRQGFAWAAQTAPATSPLRRLEAEARGAQRGLWAESNPTPPWEWQGTSVGGGNDAH